jgi:purine nucleosidase
VRLWIDTDVGTNVDDAVALLVALAHPDVDLVGVSTIGADPARSAHVARELLATAAGDAPEVPVVAGTADALDAFPGARPDAVLAIGPLTTLAALTTAGLRPPWLTIMGGALQPVRHRGALRHVESNFAADPEAAAATLAVGGATLVPLDATVATRLDDRFHKALVEAAPVLEPLVRDWLDAQAADGVPADEIAVHLHDPAALLVAAGEPVARTTMTLRLAVEADGRLRQIEPDADDPAAAEHEVVTALYATTVTALVIALLGAGAQPGPGGGAQPAKSR